VPAREVLQYPHPALKARARAPHPREVRRVAADLVDTMRAHPRCVGVAAPQIGEPVRLCVVDCSGHPKATSPHGLLVLVEPVITDTRGEAIGREGCLSIPEFTADVRRAIALSLVARDPDGAPVRVEAEGFEARAIQHEVDHLDGILFLDRVTSAAHVFRRRSHGERRG
jgi:peptide deformylase